MATCTERAVCEICSKPYGSTSSIHIVENDRCIECGEETSIFVTLEDGTTKKFVTLEEAFVVLEENETNAFIQLGADAVLESDYALENDYTLDLNGFEISCTYIDLHGKWIIQDSSLEKTGKITTESAYVFVVYNEIIIYGGTFDGAFYLSGTETNPVSMVVYDGTFTGAYGVDIYSYATVTIYNATFDNKAETFYFESSVQSTLTVHNAKFPNGGYALYYNGEESVMVSVDQVLATCAKAYDAKGNELPMTEGFTNDEAFEVKSTHNFGDWTTTKEATLNEAGEEERVCSDCQETETKEIPKLEPEKPSTSDSTSNTLAKKKGCGSVMGGGSISVCLLGMAAIFFKKKQKNN
jgi:hypothetical protein